MNLIEYMASHVLAFVLVAALLGLIVGSFLNVVIHRLPRYYRYLDDLYNKGVVRISSSLLGSKAWGRSKNEPFESGMLPTGSARLRLSAKFYLVAMLFVIFDVEALFLFAWAVSVRESGWIGLVGATVFITILFAGLVYESAIGALDWAPEGRRKRQAKLKQ